MNVSSLRRLMHKYGPLGVLLVGAYLLWHHGWHRRRSLVIAISVACLVLVGIGWLALSKPEHLLPARPLALPGVVPAPPVPTVTALSSEDDTQPGPPLPAAEPSHGEVNGDLVFAAEYFRWSGQFVQPLDGSRYQTLANVKPSHLYRMHPDGTGTRQLTWGPKDDISPVLSPDGKRLAFIRDWWEKDASLCLISSQGGPVTQLAALPGSSVDLKTRWSPDSKRIALTFTREDQNESYLWIVSVAGQALKRLSQIAECAWSPDGRLYVRDKQETAYILNPDLSYSHPIQDVVHNALWLDTHTLAGDVPDPEMLAYDGPLRLIDDAGREQRHIKLSLIGPQNSYATFNDHHVWYALPRHPSVLIMETWRGMSDGEHYGCYRLDMKTGQCRLLQDGALVGMSPDGTRIAVADWNWVGGYKRGGERVGPLQVVTLATGRTRSFTSPLGRVLGGSWLVDPKGRQAASDRLLTAIEQDDLNTLSTLLARGDDPNRRFADGATALMLAAADGNLSLVDALLRYHARVGVRDLQGRTALLYAVGAAKAADEVTSENQKQVVLRLLEAGADLNAADKEGSTALMEAASRGRAGVVALLLKKGARVNVQDHQGATALMHACQPAYPHTVAVLLHYRASPQIKNKEDCTALSVTGERQPDDDNTEARVEVKQLLQQAGAKE